MVPTAFLILLILLLWHEICIGMSLRNYLMAFKVLLFLLDLRLKQASILIILLLLVSCRVPVFFLLFVLLVDDKVLVLLVLVLAVRLVLLELVLLELVLLKWEVGTTLVVTQQCHLDEPEQLHPLILSLCRESILK